MASKVPLILRLLGQIGGELTLQIGASVGASGLQHTQVRQADQLSWDHEESVIEKLSVNFTGFLVVVKPAQPIFTNRFCRPQNAEPALTSASLEAGLNGRVCRKLLAQAGKNVVTQIVMGITCPYLARIGLITARQLR